MEVPGTASGAKKITKHFQAGDKAKGKPSDESISTPVLVFTDAESRDDLYNLDKAADKSELLRPKTAESNMAAKAGRKKPHLADLVLEPPTKSPPHKPNGPAPRPVIGEHSISMSAGIGVALGSPSQSPWTYNQTVGSTTSFDTRGPSPLSTSVPSPAPISDEVLRDRGKWKMFGGLFGKKATSNPVTPGTPFYKAQYPKSAFQIQQQPASSSAAFPKHRRVSSRSLDHIPYSVSAKPPPTGWAPVQPPRRPPSDKQDPAPGASQTRSPTPPPKDYPTKPVLVTRPSSKTVPTITSEPATIDFFTRIAKPKNQMSLLEIDIPDVSMERYSIMFSDVLKPRQSLLERRQGQLSQLKMVDTLKEEDTPPESHIPVRRATVPSPTYSLFPLPPSGNKSITPSTSGLKRLQRSATAPPASPFGPEHGRPLYPQRQDSKTFPLTSSPSQSSDTPASLHDQWQSDLSPVSTVASEKGGSEDEHGQAPSIFIRLSQSSSDAESDDAQHVSSPKIDIDASKEQPKPLSAPPKGHLPSRPDENKSRHESQAFYARGSSLPRKELPAPAMRRKQSLSRQQADHTTENFRQLVQPNPLQSSPATATEISIARKLSLSRRQQMLVPIVPKTVQQPQQPKLINPDESQEPPDHKLKRSPSRPREKSQYIVYDSM